MDPYDFDNPDKAFRPDPDELGTRAQRVAYYDQLDQAAAEAKAEDEGEHDERGPLTWDEPQLDLGIQPDDAGDPLGEIS